MKFRLTAGSASEAVKQVRDQENEARNMKTLNRLGLLQSKGGRSSSERIADAEQAAKDYQEQYRSRFDRRR